MCNLSGVSLFLKLSPDLCPVEDETRSREDKLNIFACRDEKKVSGKLHCTFIRSTKTSCVAVVLCITPTLIG